MAISKFRRTIWMSTVSRTKMNQTKGDTFILSMESLKPSVVNDPKPIWQLKSMTYKNWSPILFSSGSRLQERIQKQLAKPITAIKKRTRKTIMSLRISSIIRINAAKGVKSLRQNKSFIHIVRAAIEVRTLVGGGLTF